MTTKELRSTVDYRKYRLGWPIFSKPTLILLDAYYFENVDMYRGNVLI